MSSLHFSIPDPNLPIDEPARSTRQATRLAAGISSELPLVDSAASTTQRIRKLPREDPETNTISQLDLLSTSGNHQQVGDSVAAARVIIGLPMPIIRAGTGGTVRNRIEFE